MNYARRNMFVVDLNYVVPLSEIEPLIDGHMEFLKQQYSNGVFLVSGAKVPRTGGIIIAVADNKLQLEDILSADPFKQHQVAEYQVTEFSPTMMADQLSFLSGS